MKAKYTTQMLRSFIITEQNKVNAELQDMEVSWGEAQAAAKDRTLWTNTVVEALCLTGDEEAK